MNFAGKTIVITGAARGQGAEEARQLAALGANVVITDVLNKEGEALAKEIGEKAVFVRHDVTNEADWQGLTDLIKARGGLHGLVNNAAIFDPRPIQETDRALFERHSAINETGTFLGIRFAEATAVPDGASVVNISSVAGIRAMRGVAYTSSKWAVRGMTKSAALELAPRRIRVNSVHPGLIRTPLLAGWTEERFAQRATEIPMGRIGVVDDVAKLVIFLLSDDSSYITGAEISVDGGTSI